MAVGPIKIYIIQKYKEYIPNREKYLKDTIKQQHFGQQNSQINTLALHWIKMIKNQQYIHDQLHENLKMAIRIAHTTCHK